jgi:uncharacterized protein (DUF433 family)
MPDYRERVHADPAILNGKPVIRGTRISVEPILHHLSEGENVADLTGAWTNLTMEDIQAALAYSANVIAHEEILVG